MVLEFAYPVHQKGVWTRIIQNKEGRSVTRRQRGEKLGREEGGIENLLHLRRSQSRGSFKGVDKRSFSQCGTKGTSACLVRRKGGKAIWWFGMGERGREKNSLQAGSSRM